MVRHDDGGSIHVIALVGPVRVEHAVEKVLETSPRPA
jgi:hypothetical protein